MIYVLQPKGEISWHSKGNKSKWMSTNKYSIFSREYVMQTDLYAIHQTSVRVNIAILSYQRVCQFKLKWPTYFFLNEYLEKLHEDMFSCFHYYFQHTHTHTYIYIYIYIFVVINLFAVSMHLFIANGQTFSCMML